MHLDLLTFNDAWKSWQHLLLSAARGQPVRIDVKGKVVELHLVDSSDPGNAVEDYDVTTEELGRFEKSVHAEIPKDRQAGKLHEYTGDIESLLERQADG